MKDSEMILMLGFKVKMLECPLDVPEVPGFVHVPLCFQVIHESSRGCAIKTQLGTVSEGVARGAGRVHCSGVAWKPPEPLFQDSLRRAP